MPTCEIIDTFPVFFTFWRDVQQRPIETQIDAWLDSYMSHWPELLKKQMDDYASLKEDWRVTAVERIFPAIPERLLLIQTARDNLLEICDDVYSRCRQITGFDSDLVCIIYVGLGCGAGWATDYAGRPAILFGLENIAEEGWQERERLEGLVAHETGHLVHFEWRKKAGLANQEGAWWQLYTEGFAQRCEDLILGRPSWHMQQSAPEKGWLKWCHGNRPP